MISTTLAAPMAANALSMRVASVAGAVVGGFAKVDNEFMKIVQIVAPIVSVRARGDEGGTSFTHDTGSWVVFGTDSEKPLLGSGETIPAPTDDRSVISVGQDGLIPWNSLRRDTLVTLAKPSAAAITLEAPSAAQDGVTLTITSQTAFAHVVTSTGLFDDGVTGGAKSAATFSAFVGASVMLQANRGHWTVLSAKGVAVA